METKTAEVNKELSCSNCGAQLKYAAGTQNLKCDFCGTENEIFNPEAQGEKIVEEIDFEKFLSENSVGTEQKMELTTVNCDGCGASSTLKPNLSSDNCAFCGNPLVVKNASTCNVIRPKYLLPFKLDNNAATGALKKWIGGLWFAPGDLKLYANRPERLNGIYMPYWTYDAATDSNYTGMRGINYTATETYSAMENGKSVTRTRTVTRTRWTSCSGRVNCDFDDVLVHASRSLPDKYAMALEPWDMDNLCEYSDKFLAGFKTEVYQTNMKEGFEFAKARMTETIRNHERSDIGGDQQRILTLNTRYDNITFKHILLPVWISSYRYNGKVYRFVINARTGEVQGERPYSVAKIIGFSLGVVEDIAFIFYLIQ